MDKLDKLYELYKSKGIITDATPIEKFRAASEEQREKLYNIGKSKNLFKTTDLNTFNSAWVEGVTSKKKEESVSPSVQEDTSSATQGMASPEPLVYFQDLLMRGNKAIDQGKSSEYKKIKEEIEVLAQSNPESLGTEEAKAEYKKLNDRYSNIFKVEEPLRLENFVPNAAEISKKAGSDVDYTPEELKAKNFVNLVRLGTVGDLNERLQKDEEIIEEEFAEEDLGSKALKLYDKLVKSPLYRQYSRTTFTDRGLTKKEKYIEKAAQQIATQWNKPTPPTEEDILTLAKEIRRKELNKYSEEKAIEEVVANSDDENYFEKLYNNYKSISDPASAVISEMESTNEKTVIKNALQSAELKRKEHIEDFSTKQELVERALNEFNSLREEYGEDITKYTKEQLISLEAAQGKAKDLYDDLEQNYSKIDNDASSVGSVEEELDLFKRNYGALSKFMGEFSAGATDLAAGFAGIGEMALDLAQVSDTESDTMLGKSANFLGEISEEIRGSVSTPKEIDRINSVGEFMEFAGSLFASQAPQLLMNAGTGLIGSRLLMPLSAAGNKYTTTFKDEEEYKDWQRYVAALGAGLAEFGSEYLTGRVLQRAFPGIRIARAAERGASKAELDFLKRQFSSGLEKGIRAATKFAKKTSANFNEEALSEALAQSGGNFVDRYVLGKKDVGILDGVSDAYLTGGILGSGLTAAPALFSGVVSAVTKDPNKIIVKNLKKIEKLISAHANASSNAVKRSINQEIGQLKEENNAIIVGGLERLNKMSPKEIRRAVEIHEAIGNIREEFSNVDKDKNLSKEEKDEVKSFLAQRYNQLVTEKTQLIEKADAVQEQTTSEVPVQPEARVGEEVAQGTPQAEPEVVTEKGVKEEEIKSKSIDDLEKRMYEIEDTYGGIPSQSQNKSDAEEYITIEKELESREWKSVINSSLDEVSNILDDLDKKNKEMPNGYEAFIDPSDIRQSREVIEKYSSDVSKQEATKDFKDAFFGNPSTWYADALKLRESARAYIEQGGNIKELLSSISSEFQNDGFTEQDAANVINTKLNAVKSKIVEEVVKKEGVKEEGLTFEEATDEDISSEEAKTLFDKAKQKGAKQLVEVARDDSGKIIAAKFEYQDEAGTNQTEIVNIKTDEQVLATEQGTQAPIEGTKLRDNIKKAVAKVFTKTDSVSFKNGKDMAAYALQKYGAKISEQEGARVFVKPDGSVEIIVNEELADDTSFGHEVWHPILLKAFGDSQAKFKGFRKSINKTLRDNGYTDLADSLDEFVNQYKEDEVPSEEYLAQLGGVLTSANIDVNNITPEQKSLLDQIKEIVNNIMVELTGQPVFLEDATPKDILNFMSTMSDMMAKGEDISGFFADEADKTTDVKSRSQKAAIEILDGPKFDNKLKEDVASYLNSLRDSEIPPNSSREQLMERFINNVYEEVGYYLFSKPDARSAGLTWYIEDMVEFENKVKVILPELSNEKQYKLFLSILAFTSSGTNPNQNLSYAYNLWNNSNDPKNFKFSKDWGDKKLSFVDKKGKAVASGVIVKETAKEYTVELVDSLGRPEVDSKGNKKYEKISKASMKPGYPKSTGYTNRGKIIVGQLEKLEKLHADFKSIDAVVEWLETPHPISELRKYNEAVPDVNGKGPGKTNKKYDPSKNAEGERNGAFIFGEKIGSFYQNMIGIGETITMDLWWSRTWNRYMGTMINTTSGNKEIQEVPRSDRERNIMREAVKMVAEDLNLQVSELQAAIWYFEQELWTKSGNASPSYSYVTAIDELTEKLKVDEETRTKLRAAEADLTEAEKRRKNAAERAAAVVASKGGEIPKVKVTTRAQKATEATENDFVLPFGKYKGQWYTTTPKAYKEWLLKQDWFDPRKYFKKKQEEATTTRAQKAQPKTIPGYDRMIEQLDGVITKARRRGADKERVYQDALGYLQGSKVYEDANDVEREALVRDLHKKLGIKERRVARAFATRKDTKKVTVSEKQALLDLIRAEARAAKTAIQAWRAVSVAVKAELDTLFARGHISTRQVRAILNKALNLNFLNHDHVRRFVDYMEKVYNNAEYADNLKKAESTKKRIKRAVKNKDVQAETRDIAKKFLEIEPFFAEDIEAYLKVAEEVLNATSSTVGKVVDGDPVVSFKQAMNYENVLEYTEKALEFQEELKKQQILDKNADLVESGVLDPEMSLEEIKYIIKNLDENPDNLPSAEKQKMLRDFVKRYYDSYKAILKSVLDNGIDPFTGESVNLTQEQENLLRRFLDIDLETLSLKDAYKIIESIDNFIVNQNTDGMLGSVEAYEGRKGAKEAKEKGFKARKLRAFFSKGLGRTWAVQIEQLSLITERMFGERKALLWDKLSGLNDLMAVKNKAFTRYNRYVENYSNQFKNIKDFNSLENMFSRAILGYVSRTSQGSEIQQQNEFKKRKKNIKVSIEAMKKGTEKQQKEAEVLMKIYDEILADSNSAREVASKSKDFNRKAVSYWQAAFSDIFDDLQSVSRGVYNTLLERDFKYLPDVYSRSEEGDVGGVEKMSKINSAFFGINENFDTKESGSIMIATKPELQDNPARIVSFDFDSNMARSLQSAIVDIETAPLIRKIDAFYNSPEIKTIIGAEDLAVLKNRVAGYIRATKRKDFQSYGELEKMAKAINYISTFAAARALGSLTQIPKQTISVAFNTMINSGGRLPLADVLKAKEFIDKSGYAIGLRGIASQADIQSMNKILKRAEESTGMKALEALKRLNEFYLETFVAKPDVFIARASWLAYYKQELNRMGVDTKDINWETHKLNRDAADYAQRKTDRQQNYSDADLAGDFLRSKSPVVSMLRKTIFPFATFMMNKRSVLLGDISTLSNDMASKEDKKSAGLSLASNAVEMAIFHSLSIFLASTVYGFLAEALAGGDEEDEEKKEARELKGKMYRVQSTVNEFLSPVPGVTDKYVDDGINKLLSMLDVDKKYQLPEAKEESFGSKIGMVNIPMQKLDMSYDISEAALKGYVEYRGKKTTLEKEDQENMKIVATIYGLYAMGALPADAGSIAQKAYYMIINKSKAKKKKSKSAMKTKIGGMSGKIKSELK